MARPPAAPTAARWLTDFREVAGILLLSLLLLVLVTLVRHVRMELPGDLPRPNREAAGADPSAPVGRVHQAQR